MVLHNSRNKTRASVWTREFRCKQSLKSELVNPRPLLRAMRIVYKFRSSRLETCYIKKYAFWKFWKVFLKTLVVGSCFNETAGPVTVLNRTPPRLFFREFSKICRTVIPLPLNSCLCASVISLYLHGYTYLSN